MRCSSYALVFPLLACALLLACSGSSGSTGAGMPSPGFSPSLPSNGGTIARFVTPGGNDANDGSAGAPWATLQQAAASASPGMTVHVAPGTYQGPLITSQSGSPGARIRYVSDQQWGAQIRSSGTRSIWLNSGSYVDIVGFDVSGQAEIGIENDGGFVLVAGNRVHDIPSTGGDGDGGAGIVQASFTASDNETIGNMVFNIGLGTPTTTVQGIYHSNLRGRIVNNIVLRADGWGIQLWHAATNVLVANNTVVNNLSGGIVIGAGDAPGGVTDDGTKTMNNLVVANGPFGIEEFGSTGPNNLFSHNLLAGNGTPLLLQAGVATGSVLVDPGFVNYTGAANGDYHLRPGSAAIDTGDPDFAPNNDFSGGTRPVGAGFDIGAYEFGAAPANWPWY